MSEIGLFYGSSSGCTETAAELIKDFFENLQSQHTIRLFNIAECDIGLMQNYPKLILGVSTWHIGELQPDWDDNFEALDTLDFTGKTVALFGLGDQFGYADTFQDGIGILGRKVRDQGARLVGYWPVDGYDFEDSVGVEDGQFMGLSLDEDNESELTEERVHTWVKQLLGELT